jgi:hypothetical protein
MQDKITAALQKHGRPLSPGALAHAIGTGTGPLRKVVDGMIAAGALKATGERRGRRIGLPDMEFAAAGESQTPPQRQKKHKKAKHAKRPRAAKPAPRARAADGASPSGAPVAERFIPTVDIEVRDRRRRAALARREEGRPEGDLRQRARAHRRAGARGAADREPAARRPARARGGRGLRRADEAEEDRRRGPRDMVGQPQLRLRPHEAARALPGGAQGVLRRRASTPPRRCSSRASATTTRSARRSRTSPRAATRTMGRCLPRGAQAHRRELHAAAEGARPSTRRTRTSCRRPAAARLPEAHRQPARSLRRRQECRRLHRPEVLRRQAPGALQRPSARRSRRRARR